MNTDDLLKKTTTGEVTSEELEKIHDALLKKKKDIYKLLLIIGRSRAVRYRKTVEQFIDSPHDPMLSRLSLLILCRYWGLGNEYKDEIVRFIRKVAWDEDGDVRLMALGCAEEILADETNTDLLDEVYRIFNDTSEEQIIREAAYCALAIAAGGKRSELPPASKRFSLVDDIDKSLIARIESRLGA